jgi:hypothetical protein
MLLTNIHGFFWTELPMPLKLRDELIGKAAELPKVVDRSFVQDIIAVIVMGGLAKCMQHLIWSLI